MVYYHARWQRAILIGCGRALSEVEVARMTSKSTERRVTVKDLEGRVSDLENKIDDLTTHIQKLDQRVQKLADSVAATRASQV